MFKSVLAVLCGTATTIFLGCAKQTDLPPTNSSVSTTASDSPEVAHRECTIEILEENPAATSRQIFTGILGKPVEIHTQYKNGDTGVAYLEESSGQVKECKEIFSSNKLKSHAVFSRDGKLVKGELYRPDGSLRLVREITEKGYFKSSFYLPKSAFPYMSEAEVSSTRAERDIFLSNGTLRAKVHLDTVWEDPLGEPPLPNQTKRPTIKSTTYFKSDGKIERKVAYSDASNTQNFGWTTGQIHLKVCWYRDNGSLEFLQNWTRDYLISVEEYELDGITTKRNIMVVDGYLPLDGEARIISPLTVFEYEQGGPAIVKQFFDRKNYSNKNNLQTVLISPEYNRGDTNFYQPERLWLNTPLTDVVNLNASGPGNGVIKHAPDEKVYEKFDVKLFKFFRDPELDANWRHLASELDDYLGLPLNKEDTCRTWYLNRPIEMQALQM
jgi:hypothetical protein